MENTLHEGKGLSVGVGWLDGSAADEDPSRLLDVVSGTFGRGRDGASMGFYGASVGFDGGRAAVHWNGKGGAAGTVRAEVRQSALDGLGFDGSLGLADRLVGAGWRASRLDVYVDDVDRVMTPTLVRGAVLGGQAVTRAEPGQWWEDDADGRTTYYLGAPTSERRVRWYDKPEPDRTRMELQARRRSARHVLDALMAGPRSSLVAVTSPPEPVGSGEEWPAARGAVLGAVVAFVDFRARRAGGANGSRAARLAWWQTIVGDVRRLGAVPARPGLSLDERAEWFMRCMAATLAELVRELGTDWLERVLSAGFERLDREGAL